jgi:Large polyvalent protein-associated domain 7
VDESNESSRPGGTIFPDNLGDIALASIRRRAASQAVRYELRDPFAEVTYRTESLSDILAKADKVGSDRFTEIDQAGLRTTVRKVDGQWQRGPQRPALALHVSEAPNQRDEVPDRLSDDGQPDARLPPQAEKAERRDAARDAATAERAELERRVSAELSERYVIKHGPTWWGGANQTEYRFRGNLERVAFTEARYRLATDTNNPSVARSMVDVAQARGWQGLRISGHDDFRRMAWLEATLRGIRAVGYEPVPGDIELLHRERDARRINRIEPGAAPSASTPATKTSARGSGTRKTVLAAIDAVLVAQRVPEQRREAIMAAAKENLNRRLAAGEVHKVKVYDRSAPSQRAAVQPTLEPQRSRERAQPGR